MTPELAASIKAMHKHGLYQSQIAAELGINQGRVSEVVNGRTFTESRPVDDRQLPFDFG